MRYVSNVTFEFLMFVYVGCCSGFLPVAINFLRRVPVVGSLLNLPGIRTVSKMLAKSIYNVKV